MRKKLIMAIKVIEVALCNVSHIYKEQFTNVAAYSDCKRSWKVHSAGVWKSILTRAASRSLDLGEKISMEIKS